MDAVNCIQGKSFDFAVRIIRLYKYLAKEQKEYVLSKQLLRSGTSIGANVNEAQAGQSRADFVSKMCIASKEARETRYWLDLLCETDYLDPTQAHVATMLEQSEELIKILTSIVKTTQQKTNKP
jgi:four helix bundle protein